MFKGNNGLKMIPIVFIAIRFDKLKWLILSMILFILSE